jgi:FtsZ-binding cell division protein ZapB
MKKVKETDEEDILQRLHERVEKAIGTIQELRRERDSLKARLEQAESGASERVASLEEDCARFQKERDEIRDRIESILSNLESLDA